VFADPAAQFCHELDLRLLHKVDEATRTANRPARYTLGTMWRDDLEDLARTSKVRRTKVLDVAVHVLLGPGARGTSASIAGNGVGVSGNPGAVVAAMSIRDLDDSVRERLRSRAAGHGRSMEAEIRTILTDAVREPSETMGLAGALLDRFGGPGGLGGLDLDLRARTTMPRAADLPS